MPEAPAQMGVWDSGIVPHGGTRSAAVAVPDSATVRTGDPCRPKPPIMAVMESTNACYAEVSS